MEEVRRGKPAMPAEQVAKFWTAIRTGCSRDTVGEIIGVSQAVTSKLFSSVVG